jgi:hypothetical protein
MDGAFIGNFKKAGALLFVEITRKYDLALDLVHFPLLGFAFFAVFGVNLAVSEAYLNIFEWPSLAIGVHPERHGSARPQADEQKFIWRWPCVVSPCCAGLIRQDGVLTHLGTVHKFSAAGFGDNNFLQLIVAAHLRNLPGSSLVAVLA